MSLTDFAHEDSDSLKHFHLPKRMSVDDGKLSRFPLASMEAFTRPISALARHRVHQLSDIREVSGSSKIVTHGYAVPEWNDGCMDRPTTPAPQADALSHTTSSEYLTPTAFHSGTNNYTAGLGSRAASAVSLPHRSVPERTSSASILSRSFGDPVQASMRELPTWKISELDGTETLVRDKVRAESPVRRSIGRAAQSSEVLRPVLSRTFVRTSPPHEVLDHGSIRHPRVELSVSLPSPLFVGGGTVEGQLTIQVDGGMARKPKTKPIYISKACVDVIGVEEVNDGRRWVFLSLATDLFDVENPPPPSLVTSQDPAPGADLWWEMRSATSVVPFCINLPLKLGPPPYSSRQAAIRYLLCPSIVMLTVHDPEKALASLASPLLAADTLYLAREPDIQTVKLTAGLHRQTWVNGALIFIDVHIANNTARSVKKIEVQLEKTTLWYTHAPAGTAEKSANYLRLPKRTDAEVVSGTTLKKSSTWKGVPSHSSDVRTIELEAPRGHVTISTGRYFEVRYFVNVVVTVKMFKTVAVQLPVTIIPINSLDILPNSLAQVAASIEAKRSKTVPAPPPGPSYAAHHQGQAFTAPVRRSAERARQERLAPQDDLDSLANDIDTSPRRLAHTHTHRRGGLSGTTTDENIAPGRPSMASSSHHHLQRHPSCYHCQISPENNSPLKPVGPRLPRLQVSTSGLGFSESEFEIPPDSPPRKVMLSEQERNMIHRQRELQNRQQRSQWAQKRSSGENKRSDDLCTSKDHPSYANVVADPKAGPKQNDFGNLSPGVRRKGDGPAVPRSLVASKGPSVVRSRSKTNPEGPRYRPSISKPRRRSSADRHDRIRASVDGSGFPIMPRRFSKDLPQRGSLDRLF
ncbi:hypothetical protein AYL99_07064 [Fonsecaea erecta]|uniref:Arrestin C-terminal-like domain-containing protein n=1 Tax=Fonsecaea erecta TaxID=1367422 RepID=A0A178ZDU0_9EURO|nr:hypothetical protein AYL99_07064 [Fonsecaea erecta]OAP57974.1 hypothetical protein AYL99_07064 [Fonsecaea erecta]